MIPQRPISLSLDEQEVLFNAWEGGPLWDLAAGGDGSSRAMLRIHARAALSRLVDSGLVELAGEPVENEKWTGVYLPLSPVLAAQAIATDAAWATGGVFEAAGTRYFIWLGLTTKGRESFDGGAAQDVVMRVTRHLRNPLAQRKSVHRILGALRRTDKTGSQD